LRTRNGRHHNQAKGQVTGYTAGSSSVSREYKYRGSLKTNSKKEF